MPKHKYTMIYFDDEIGNSDGIHFVNTLANNNLCSVSSDDYNSLLRQAEGMRRRFWIGLFKDAEIILRHVLPPSGE